MRHRRAYLAGLATSLTGIALIACATPILNGAWLLGWALGTAGVIGMLAANRADEREQS